MVQARGSGRLVKVARERDADASLEAVWLISPGEIISRGFMAELEVPSILVSARELVELEKIFGEMESSVVGIELEGVDNPDVVGAFEWNDAVRTLVSGWSIGILT